MKFKRTKIYLNIPHFGGSASELSLSSLHSHTPVAEDILEEGPDATAVALILSVQVEDVTVLVPTIGGFIWGITENTCIKCLCSESQGMAEPVGLLATHLYMLNRTSYYQKRHILYLCKLFNTIITSSIPQLFTPLVYICYCEFPV